MLISGREHLRLHFKAIVISLLRSPNRLGESVLKRSDIDLDAACLPGHAPLTVGKVGALSDLDNITVDHVRVRDAERYRRFVGSRPASDVDKKPRIRNLNVRRCAAVVAAAQNATAENCFVVASRPVDVGDGEEVCDGETVTGGHLIAVPIQRLAVNSSSTEWRNHGTYHHCSFLR